MDTKRENEIKEERNGGKKKKKSKVYEIISKNEGRDRENEGGRKENTG